MISKFIPLFATLLLTPVFADIPISGEKYAITNTVNGGSIRPVGDGKICSRLSPINVVQYLPDPIPEEDQWELDFAEWRGYWTMQTVTRDQGAFINAITYGNVPPFCYLVYRYLDFIPDRETYIIRDIETEECLTLSGGNAIWRSCGADGQRWNFIKV